MHLHLFSSPGERDIRYILDASHPYLTAATNPVVAYLPAASWGSNWLEYTEKAFAGLGEVASIDIETITPACWLIEKGLARRQLAVGMVLAR